MLRFRTDCAREHTGKCGCIDTNGLTAKSTSHQPPHVADKCIVGNVTLQLRILLATGRLAWKYTGRIVSTLYGSISRGLTQMTFRSIRKGISRRSRVNERPRSRYMTTRKLATTTLSERLLCLKAWKRTRLSPDISTGSLKSGCRFGQACRTEDSDQIEQQANRKLEPKAT